MIEDFVTCDQARIPIVWFVTHEETRAEVEVASFARKTGRSLWVWSLTSDDGSPGWEAGLTFSKKGPCPFDKGMAAAPHLAVKSVVNAVLPIEDGGASEGAGVIAIFRDPHCFLAQEPSFLRALRDASRALKGTDSSILCISPVGKLPEDLQIDVPVLYPELPTKDQLKEILLDQLKVVSSTLELPELLTTEADPLADACVGMTFQEATDALMKSLISFKKVDLTYLLAEKTKAISNIPGLTFIGKAPSLSDVGGMAGLKEWLVERKDGFSDEARDFNLPMPRALLALGVPGCGKSLFAKAIAAELKLPLIQMNPPDIKGGIVGETEGNFRRVKRALATLGKVVVWIDELEKCLPKAGDRNLDGGTSDALLQGLLNWMQEREGGVFLIATANDVSALPPELLRKGRWDAIFFVDLPIQAEREEIFNIHLKKIHRTLSKEDIQLLARETNGYSGAEIEAGVIDGLWRAFSDGRRALSAEDIRQSMILDVPLSKMMEHQITNLRAFAEKGARSASQKAEVKTTQQQQTIPIRKIRMEK